MENKILGLHHITAIAGNAKQNLEFYTKVLGQRLVKKTVNFDDPSTYHFYFGDEKGSPGSILTFFPWEGIGKGHNGTGMATNIGYAVPEGSLEFWADRFKRFNVKHEAVAEKFGEKFIHFQDLDGLHIDLIISKNVDNRTGYANNEINESVATKGFHSVTLTLKNVTPTAKILTDILGYELLQQEGNHYRFVTPNIPTASIVDIIEAPGVSAGINAAGTNHHMAFRIKNEMVQMEFREKILSAGLNITPKIDRDYFYSMYFREPGGVLFELATENPGFSKDEAENELGTHLKLPTQYESSRKEIEKVLAKLD